MQDRLWPDTQMQAGEDLGCAASGLGGDWSCEAGCLGSGVALSCYTQLLCKRGHDDDGHEHEGCECDEVADL
jgi:hypothetical protein